MLKESSFVTVSKSFTFNYIGMWVDLVPQIFLLANQKTMQFTVIYFFMFLFYVTPRRKFMFVGSEP